MLAAQVREKFAGGPGWLAHLCVSCKGGDDDAAKHLSFSDGGGKRKVPRLALGMTEGW